MSQSRPERKSRFRRYHRRVKRGWLAPVLAAAVALGCGKPAAPPSAAPEPSPRPEPTSTPTPAAFVPDLGQLMSIAQMRHAKLWFAGEAGNWKLAAYELQELKEGFEQIARYRPTHKDSPVPIDQAIETIMMEPLADIGKAIEKKDRRLFARTYDTVTDGCNACHEATDFGFNVMRRPVANPYSNQSFAPPR